MLRCNSAVLSGVLLSILLRPVGESNTGKLSHMRVVKAHSNTLTVTRFSPDGNELATGSFDGTIKLWDVSRWRLKRTLKVTKNGVTSLAFSPDGRTLASVSDYDPIIIWDTSTGRKLRTVPLISTQHSAMSVAFSADGKLMAVGDDTGDIVLWYTSSWKLAGIISDTQYSNGFAAYSPVWNLNFSPDGRLLAAAGGDGKSHVWDIKTRKRLAFGGSDRSLSVAFTPNSKFLAVASDIGPVTIWDTVTAKKLTAESGDVQGSYAVDFSHRRRLLASGGGSGVKLWNTKTWQQSRQWVTSDWVRTLCFSPREDTLAIGTDSGDLIIWNVD